ncbi:TPA: hypothetical protein ACGUW8_000037 [Vibrio vulnificus]
MKKWRWQLDIEECRTSQLNSGLNLKIAYITEDFEEGDSFFVDDDNRAFYYQDNDFTPTSVLSPIVWSDKDLVNIEALDIIDASCLNVTKEIAEVIMSFDPYGVKIYPASLKCGGNETLSGRYLVAVDNEVDVIDQERCFKVTEATTRFYLSEEKILALEPSKRHVFNPKGMLKTFFSNELFEALVAIALEGKIKTSIVAYTFDTLDEAPRV